MKKIIAILCFLISAVLLVSCAGNAGEPEEPQVSETAQSEAPAAVEESTAPKDAPEPSASASQTPEDKQSPSSPTYDPAEEKEYSLTEAQLTAFQEELIPALTTALVYGESDSVDKNNDSTRFAEEYLFALIWNNKSLLDDENNDASEFVWDGVYGYSNSADFEYQGKTVDSDVLDERLANAFGREILNNIDFETLLPEEQIFYPITDFNTYFELAEPIRSLILQDEENRLTFKVDDKDISGELFDQYELIITVVPNPVSMYGCKIIEAQINEEDFPENDEAVFNMHDQITVEGAIEERAVEAENGLTGEMETYTYFVLIPNASVSVIDAEGVEHNIDVFQLFSQEDLESLIGNVVTVTGEVGENVQTNGYFENYVLWDVQLL